MFKGLIHALAAVAAAGFLLGAPAVAADKSPLVSVPWLEQNVKRDDVLLVDAQMGRMHTAGHIPGAVNADVFTFGGRDVSTAEMEKIIQSWGVSPDRKIVLYDEGGGYFATSLFFDLYYYGFPAENLVVLDGGLAKWKASGGAVTKDPTPVPKPGTFRISKVRDDARARLPEFLVASGDPANNVLVEALTPAEHFGGTKFFDRSGHIPHAVMAPAEDFFNADKTFKSPEEIRRMLVYLGIKPEQQLYTHCGGGIAASVPFFAAKFMLDYPKVKLYKESQLEWLRDDRDLPFWTYDAPNMTREKAWVHGWNARMLRMYGVSKLSVVDVRSPEAFGKSHVPFAINVPADVFRRNWSTPSKLAEILGASGVNPAFEAVVISDGGLTPDSALAYLMLERLGQKRVSVLSESVDDWAFAGLPVEKQDAAADAKKAPNPFLRPTSYPVALRAGTVIDNPQAAKGLYPRIYIASGKSLPAKLPEGKVVHVPYTELLDAKGSPKPAKDLWAALVKAGVPRYAELISVADEPGEAAATYFVLKLMGYPDVKVLVM